ncbi:major tail protein [Caproiciproducens sp.]
MATLGLRDLYMATVTEAADGAETFGTPKKLAQAISAKLTTTLADGTLYADDGVAEQVSEFANAKLVLEVADLADADTATLLGAKVDETSKIVFSNKDDAPPYVAIGFRAKKTGGKFRYVWLYKGKFSMPSEEFATKAEKIEFKSPTIEGTFQALNKNGAWKADITALPTDTAAATWFTAVPEPAAT